MDNKMLLNHINSYCEKEGWEVCKKGSDYLDALEGGGRVNWQKVGSRRWWDDYFCVAEIDGVLIGFSNAKTTGDSSPYDLGWEFDIESICEVERYEETIAVVSYRPKVTQNNNGGKLNGST